MPSPRQRLASLCIAGLLAIASYASAQGSGRFDLNGPAIDVNVSRGSRTLPIALVPNLQPGDKLTIHADLPPTQSVKLLLIVCFLRGSTNPPPEQWFTRIETWSKHIRAEGVTVTVPDEAQQALMFIAPETGGDFSTLKSAVRGRPGIFVRASQDLNEASFEQSRIEHYTQSIRRVPPGSPAELLDHSHKLAATLNLKPNDDCFKRPADTQLACLQQSGSQVLLDDGHGQSLAALVTSGPSADLIGSLSGSPMLSGAAAYSAYVGTVIDLVRLMSGLHTAQFQYIPAISFPENAAMNLRLNTAPSFHNPKSVIVIARPAIQKAVPPPLRLQNPQHVACLLQPAMVLPLEGAPLVFATSFGHDLRLHLNNATVDGKTDLPLTPDAYEGGLVVAAAAEHTERRPLELKAAAPPAAPAAPASPQATTATSQSTAAATSDAVLATATVHGEWGFDSFEGPTVPVQRLPGNGWVAEPRGEVISGRTNQVVLRAEGTACTQNVLFEAGPNQQTPLSWKAGTDEARADSLDVKLPLEKAAPGGINLDVHQFGQTQPMRLALTAYSDATHPESLHIHAGDTMATLSGSSLTDVKSVEVAGITFHPAPDQSGGPKELRLVNVAAAPDKKQAHNKPVPLNVGDHGTAHVTLADGRTLPVDFTVDAPRPLITILSKSVQVKSDGGPALTLMDKDAIPLVSRLSFALRSDAPARFARSEKIEVATVDGALHTTLQLSDASLILQDAHTVVGFLNPLAAFGQSAFGPLQMRPVAEDGSAGDWQPLGTLVRTPEIQTVVCGRAGVRAAPQAGSTVETTTTLGTAPATEAAAEPDAAAPAGSTAPQNPPTAAQRRGTDNSCMLTGSSLFLIDSVGADSSFSQQAHVPIGYAESTLMVPRPADNHTLYLRLRDDPDSLVTLSAVATAAGGHRSSNPGGATPGAQAANRY